MLVGHFVDGKLWSAAFRAYFHVPKRMKFAVVLLTYVPNTLLHLPLAQGGGRLAGRTGR